MNTIKGLAIPLATIDNHHGAGTTKVYTFVTGKSSKVFSSLLKT